MNHHEQLKNAPFIERQLLRAHFNRRPFTFRHPLASEQCFQVKRLAALAVRLPFVQYNAGDITCEVNPERAPANGLTPVETLHQIDTRNSWAALRHSERDPEYAPIFEELFSVLERELGLPSGTFILKEGVIIVSSPCAVTPFHIDADYNFLLQISGSKRLKVWPADDRFVLPETALESYYGNCVHPQYRTEFEASAMTFDLAPGAGLHIPINAPHWVRNGSDVSVSLSVAFRTELSERRERVYRLNAALRRIGIEPVPPGRSVWRDASKAVMHRACRAAEARLFGVRTIRRF